MKKDGADRFKTLICETGAKRLERIAALAVRMRQIVRRRSQAGEPVPQREELRTAEPLPSYLPSIVGPRRS